ncbi:hypothetical protein DY000_02042594 [Brassica cretica]|uniref:Uncharacterized protein n=1 Tax=Brassica cretica TaxID=69181 RepID=A0ABQ7BME7_BRACR|nr:hypothetical protein DY000_02042594 [Brassica cretica]
MPNSTRSNKDKHLLFSEDPTHLERAIRKDQRSTSLDATAFTSTDSRTQSSTDTRPSSSTSIHTTPRTSIDHQSRNMVAIVIFRHDENGDMCMPSNTRSNKDKHLLFSEDPAHLERTIRKDQRSTSLDAAAFTSTDSRTQQSTDTRPSSSTDLHRSTSIDTTPRTSIDHQSRNMVAIVILRQDENGNLYDQDGHLRNATANPPEPTTNPSDTTPEPMQVDEATEGRRLRKRKEKIPKNLKREANEKEMDGFTKRVLRIPVEKPFDEVYYTHRLWMFFRETKETEEDIRRMFHHVREKMKLRITLKKKSDPGKFAIPCVVNLVELGNDLGYIAACHCGAEYETEYSESIDTHISSSIDSNESPTNDEHYPKSLDGKQLVDHFSLPDQFETVIPSPNEAYDEDYWKERAIEIAMQDERYSSHSFNNTSPPSIDRVYSAAVDTHPHPAKRSYASIDTTPGTLIDIKAPAFEMEKGNIPIPSRFTNTYIRSFAPQITSHDTKAEKMNASTNQSEGTSMRTIRSKNPNSADKRLPSIVTPVSTSIDSHSKLKPSLFTKKNMSIDYDFRTPDEFGIFKDKDGHARAMDGRILQVSRKDIADILQLANGPYNLFMQQRRIPDEIGSHQSCRPVGQASIDKVSPTSFDGVTPMLLDKAPSPSIDRRYECGRRAYDIYGARKLRWEQKDEYGVYRDESGYARSVAGEMIPVTKDNIKKILERASLFEESHLCLPEHATFFTPTKLAPEIYTKDEINEMVTGICGAQEKLGDELKTLVDDTYQPLDRGYNELFRSMVEMRT